MITTDLTILRGEFTVHRELNTRSELVRALKIANGHQAVAGYLLSVDRNTVRKLIRKYEIDVKALKVENRAELERFTSQLKESIAEVLTKEVGATEVKPELTYELTQGGC